MEIEIKVFKLDGLRWNDCGGNICELVVASQIHVLHNVENLLIPLVENFLKKVCVYSTLKRGLNGSSLDTCHHNYAQGQGQECF